MPQLDKKHAKEAESAATGFAPMPDGAYHFILKDVDGTRSGGAGPYWSWEYECIEEDPVEMPIVDTDENGVQVLTGKTKSQNVRGRKQWNTTSLSQAWALKQTFDAFGVAPDTDTDELLGRPVKLVLEITTIQGGKRKGELSNNVTRVMPADDDVVKAVEKAQENAKAMADLF